MLEHVTSYGLSSDYVPPAFYARLDEVNIGDIIHLEALSRPMPWHYVLWADDGWQIFRLQVASKINESSDDGRLAMDCDGRAGCSLELLLWIREKTFLVASFNCLSLYKQCSRSR